MFHTIKLHTFLNIEKHNRDAWRKL